MADFETHDIGTFKEVQLSRKLVNTIDDILQKSDLTLPLEVVQAYGELKQHYDWQVENSKM